MVESRIISDPELRYLRHTPAGADYVSQITAQASDRRARTAFRNLVLRLAHPGAHLFDFGAGPGLDARFFAERGFTISAYDVDPRMTQFFTDHCRDLLRDGRVTLAHGSYRRFLAGAVPPAGQRAQLVICNFAPLNLVDDLRPLFARFDALTSARGQVLASVLNPFYFREMRNRWWWRGMAQRWRGGELFLPGPQAPHYRRQLRHFRAASAPYFRLTGRFPDTAAPWDRGTGWLPAATARYLFLLFDKAPR